MWPRLILSMSSLALVVAIGCGPDASVGGSSSGGLDASVSSPDGAKLDTWAPLDASNPFGDVLFGDTAFVVPEDLGPPPVYEACEEPPPASWTSANPMCLHGPPTATAADGQLLLVLERQIPTNIAAHSTPIIAYLEDDDGDGTSGPGDTPRLLSVLTREPTSEGAELRVFRGDSGSLQWAEDGIAAAATPAVADLDGDGSPEIVIPSQAGAIRVLHHDGTPFWSTPLTWIPTPWYRPHPAISDMDGDGCPEIVLGMAILDCTGAVRWEGEQAAQGVIADIDLDGTEEAVFGHMIVDPDGVVEWAWSDPLTKPQAPNSPAIANFDDDPEAEFMVAPLRKVRLHDTDGSLLWYVDLGEADPRESGSPVVGDFDRDGRLEAGIAYRDVFIMLNHDGSILWSRKIDDPSTGAVASAHDFDDDGYLEVLYADHARLQIFAGATGQTRFVDEDHVSNTFWEYPLVADVDGDGASELISGDLNGLRIFGSAGTPWRTARSVWNQHAYTLTHIREDGTVPTHALPHFLVWNTFRASAPVAVPPIHDVYPELITVCEQDCGGGLMRVRVRLHNAGTLDAPAGLRLALYGPTGAVLSIRETDQIVPALHTTDTLELLFKLADAGAGPLLLSADDDGKGAGVLDECDEANNQLVVQGPFCD